VLLTFSLLSLSLFFLSLFSFYSFFLLLINFISSAIEIVMANEQKIQDKQTTKSWKKQVLLLIHFKKN